MKSLLVAPLLFALAASATAAPLSQPSITLHGKRFSTELALTDADRARGLMMRTQLAADHSMLFVFPDTEERWFWMKNTLIPLDMIFIDEAGTVVGIVERAEPQTLAPRTVGAKSRYVLEVNGGWSAANGVGKGDRVRFEAIPGL